MACIFLSTDASSRLTREENVFARLLYSFPRVIQSSAVLFLCCSTVVSVASFGDGGSESNLRFLEDKSFKETRVAVVPETSTDGMADGMSDGGEVAIGDGSMDGRGILSSFFGTVTVATGAVALAAGDP